MEKKIRMLIAAALVIGSTACGYPNADLLSPNLIKGSEASKRINEAGFTGALLCAARTGRPASLEFSARTDTIYGIEPGRAYKEKQVDSCAQNIMLTTALSGDCSPANTTAVLFPTCVLKPVDKVTGN